MREIVDLAQKVARLPATVLIQGESGTGKELLARLLHRESGRDDAAFIAVNLAAVPRELVESNLFGHERGAFTSAVRQQLGKFELAADGTLFLDEIADLGLDLQAKLLRAIQEGEIERVGGTKTIKTEFRLVVATNVDLERAVKEGKFREDLYYRVNVIPFRLPPLRERIEDIPELVKLFLTGISDLLAPDGTFIHPRAAERTKFCSAYNRPAPEAVTSAHADVEPTGAAAFRAFLRHRSTRVPFLRQPSLHSAARQPAGTGSAQILRSISPKSRRFR